MLAKFFARLNVLDHGRLKLLQSLGFRHLLLHVAELETGKGSDRLTSGFPETLTRGGNFLDGGFFDFLTDHLVGYIVGRFFAETDDLVEMLEKLFFRRRQTEK
jgi:hypothetical protein